MKQQVRLHITPIKQYDNECASACLTMVLKAYGVEVQQEEIIHQIPAETPKWREWLYWVGVVARKYKCSAEIISMNTQILDPSWQKLSPQQLVSKLKKELMFIRNIKETKQEPYQYYFKEHWIELEEWEIRAALSFLRVGGIINIISTTQQVISQKLSQGHLGIASVDAAILYQSVRGIPISNDVCGSTWGHVVVIAPSASPFKVTVIDPADWYTPKQKFFIPYGLLIESILRRDQNILFIKKSPPNRMERYRRGR